MIPLICTSRTFTNQLGTEVTIIKYMSRIRIYSCSKKERCRSKIPFFKSMNLLWWISRTRYCPSTIELTLFKETKITFFRRQWLVECLNTMRPHFSMKILPLALSTICNSLTKTCCPHRCCQDALGTVAWESSVALTLESWFRISLSKRNYFLEMEIQNSILCNKEAIYLIIACLKIRRSQKRETTKSIIAYQTKLSHRTR